MNKGFTFIEVLITLTLMVLLMGLGIAAFDRFNDRQKVSETAFTVQNLIKSAQVKAKVAEKTVGCGQLQSYRVSIIAGAGGGVTVSAVCTPGGVIQRELYYMPDGIEAQSYHTIDFYVLNGGNNANPATPIIIQTTNNAWRYSFTVDPGGAVSQGDFIP